MNLNVCVPKYEILNTCILWVVSVLEKICQNYDIAVESLNWVIDNSMLTITDSTLILNLHLYHRTFGAFSLVAFFFFFFSPSIPILVLAVEFIYFLTWSVWTEAYPWCFTYFRLKRHVSIIDVSFLCFRNKICCSCNKQLQKLEKKKSVDKSQLHYSYRSGLHAVLLFSLSHVLPQYCGLHVAWASSFFFPMLQQNSKGFLFSLFGPQGTFSSPSLNILPSGVQ